MFHTSASYSFPFYFHYFYFKHATLFGTLPLTEATACTLLPEVPEHLNICKILLQQVILVLSSILYYYLFYHYHQKYSITNIPLSIKPSSFVQSCKRSFFMRLYFAFFLFVVVYVSLTYSRIGIRLPFYKKKLSFLVLFLML